MSRSTARASSPSRRRRQALHARRPARGRRPGRLATATGYLVLDTTGSRSRSARPPASRSRPTERSRAAARRSRSLGRLAHEPGQAGRHAVRRHRRRAARRHQRRQGYLEGSGINPTTAMVEMLTSLRTFQSDQKAIQAIDETLQKGIPPGAPKQTPPQVDHRAVREGPRPDCIRRSPGRPPMSASHPPPTKRRKGFMANGIYAAAAGMAAQQTGSTRSRTISRTPTRPATRASGSAFAICSTAPRTASRSARRDGGRRRPLERAGHARRLHNPLSLAINGPGFFQIRRADGTTALTRNGDLQLDSAGSLVTSNGEQLVPPIRSRRTRQPPT